MKKDMIVAKQWNKRKKILLLIKLFLTSQDKRAKVLRESGVFHRFGNNCYWHSPTLPAEPYMVSIHDNVKIATSVTFLTHDIIQSVFNDDISLNPENEVRKYGGYHMGTIEVCDNVFIGGHTVVCPGVKIGPNAIVAAGSVIVKDVLPGTIVGGNPARVIGSYDELAKKRYEMHHKKGLPGKNSLYGDVEAYYWNKG